MATLTQAFGQVQATFDGYTFLGKTSIRYTYSTDVKAAVRSINGVVVTTTTDDRPGATIEMELVYNEALRAFISEVWNPFIVSGGVMRKGILVVSDVNGTGAIFTMTNAVATTCVPNDMAPGPEPSTWKIAFVGMLQINPGPIIGGAVGVTPVGF